MVESQTIVQVLNRLVQEGYTEDFRVHQSMILSSPKNIKIDPTHLVVDKFYRFEGETNLDDEAIIFALSCPKHALKGTYLVAFGPMMDAADVAMVQKLKENSKNI